MKKILIAVMGMMMLSSCAYGAVSEDMSAYVRKDLFEVYMQSLSANMEKIVQRMDKLDDSVNKRFDKLEADVNKVNQVVANLSGRVEGLDKRIDDLRNGIYLWLAAVGLVVAIMAWPKVQDMLPKWRKPAPPITLDDVRRLIEENNVILEKKFQV